MIFSTSVQVVPTISMNYRENRKRKHCSNKETGMLDSSNSNRTLFKLTCTYWESVNYYTYFIVITISWLKNTKFRSTQSVSSNTCKVYKRALVHSWKISLNLILKENPCPRLGKKLKILVVHCPMTKAYLHISNVYKIQLGL